MFINANQVLFLFFCHFCDYGMKACKTHGVVTLNLNHTMSYQFLVSFNMNDTILYCSCESFIDLENKIISLTFSPKQKFDIFSLILPCHQDPQIIQKTYNSLYTKLLDETFNIKYELTFDQLSQLHMEFIDGKNK